MLHQPKWHPWPHRKRHGVLVARPDSAVGPYPSRSRAALLEDSARGGLAAGEGANDRGRTLSGIFDLLFGTA